MEQEGKWLPLLQKEKEFLDCYNCKMLISICKPPNNFNINANIYFRTALATNAHTYTHALMQRESFELTSSLFPGSCSYPPLSILSPPLTEKPMNFQVGANIELLREQLQLRQDLHSVAMDRSNQPKHPVFC